MKYKVVIRETLEKVVEVEADTAENAVDAASADYYQDKIVLYPEDCTGIAIELYKD